MLTRFRTEPKHAILNQGCINLPPQPLNYQHGQATLVLTCASLEFAQWQKGRKRKKIGRGSNFFSINNVKFAECVYEIKIGKNDLLIVFELFSAKKSNFGDPVELQKKFSCEPLNFFLSRRFI